MCMHTHVHNKSLCSSKRENKIFQFAKGNEFSERINCKIRRLDKDFEISKVHLLWHRCRSLYLNQHHGSTNDTIHYSADALASTHPSAGQIYVKLFSISYYYSGRLCSFAPDRNPFVCIGVVRALMYLFPCTLHAIRPILFERFLFVFSLIRRISACVCK